MIVRRLKLENFRGFTSLDLSFDDRLTVIVGRNGSGKTSILDAVVLAFSGGDPSRPSNVRVGSEQAQVTLVADQGEFGVDIQRNSAGKFQGRAPECLKLFYRVPRGTDDQTPGSTQARSWAPVDAHATWQDASASYSELFSFLREMEDLENEQVRYKEGSTVPQLEAVRKAVVSFLRGFSSLRVRRMSPPLSLRPALFLTKTLAGQAVELPFDAFSEGERSMIALVADLARRLALLGFSQPDADPLEGTGLVLIDEIEQHLHPGWQRQVIQQLPKTFPNVQFIVTTQSPVVVSEVTEANLRVIENFAVVESSHHRGRHVNAILEETFGTSSRPEEVQVRLDDLADKLDDRQLEQAESLLHKLEDELGQTDPDIVYYRNIFERLRPQGPQG